MFWRKKDANKVKVEAGNRPPVEEIEQFLEWLLRFGPDFDEYRDVLRGSKNNFVNSYREIIAKDVAGCADEASLSACMDGICSDYMENYFKLVDTAGGLRNLPSHRFDKAFPLLVRLRALAHVRQQKYQVAPAEQTLEALGALPEI